MHTTFDTGASSGERKAKVEDLNRSWSAETVAESAEDVHQQYPDKRLVIHFMQPHAPYFGEKAAELREVPWLVLESESRRDVTDETPREQDEVDEAELKEQLTALGYK